MAVMVLMAVCLLAAAWAGTDACQKNKVSISRKRICEPGNFKMCLEAAYAGTYVYRRNRKRIL